MMNSSYSSPRYGAAPIAYRGPEARLGFLRKTYSLFFASVLSATAGALAALNIGEPVALGRVAVPPVVAWVGSAPIMMLVLVIAAGFGLNLVKRIPGVGVAALLGYTFLTGLFVSPLIYFAQLNASSGHALSSNPVRDAFFLASAAFGGLTTYALVSRRDFSFLAGFLWMGLLVLIGASLLSWFAASNVFNLAIASVGVLIFGAYVLYDTSRLLRDADVLHPIDAAVGLYLDFFNIFIYLLQIFGSSRERD